MKIKKTDLQKLIRELAKKLIREISENALNVNTLLYCIVESIYKLIYNCIAEDELFYARVKANISCDYDEKTIDKLISDVDKLLFDRIKNATDLLLQMYSPENEEE